MSLVARIAIDILMAVGALFALAGVIGVLKMPDVFCRMQASTCATTLGAAGALIAAAIFAGRFMGDAATTVKVLLILSLVITVNPVGAHAICKGAYRSGIRPDKTMEHDDFRRDFNE